MINAELGQGNLEKADKAKSQDTQGVPRPSAIRLHTSDQTVEEKRSPNRKNTQTEPFVLPPDFDNVYAL